MMDGVVRAIELALYQEKRYLTIKEISELTEQIVEHKWPEGNIEVAISRMKNVNKLDDKYCLIQYKDYTNP